MDTTKEYTVYDVMATEYNLEPMVCLYCGSNEVAYYQYQHDAHCESCGEWQLPEDEWFRIHYPTATLYMSDDFEIPTSPNQLA